MTRPELPKRDRERSPEPVTTYQIHWRDGLETVSWRVAEAWSGVGVRVTAVTEGRR